MGKVLASMASNYDGPLKKARSNYSFPLNKNVCSNILDVDPAVIAPVENDWQSEDILPTLKNNLDLLPKCPGIFPSESIASFDKARLMPFFSKLPQFS